MSAPVPPGRVSRVRGRWQAPALRLLTAVLVGVSGLSLVLPDDAARAAGTTCVALCVAAPLLRVAWLVRRFLQEHDLRFAVHGLALLALVALGAALATRVS